MSTKLKKLYLILVSVLIYELKNSFHFFVFQTVTKILMTKSLGFM